MMKYCKIKMIFYFLVNVRKTSKSVASREPIGNETFNGAVENYKSRCVVSILILEYFCPFL